MHTRRRVSVIVHKLLQQFALLFNRFLCRDETRRCSVACPGDLIGAETEGRERAGVLGEWAASRSPPARGTGGVLWAPPEGFGAEPWPPKGFPLFSALRMASPDTELPCSHWGQASVPPPTLAYDPDGARLGRCLVSAAPVFSLYTHSAACAGDNTINTWTTGLRNVSSFIVRLYLSLQ